MARLVEQIRQFAAARTARDRARIDANIKEISDEIDALKARHDILKNAVSVKTQKLKELEIKLLQLKATIESKINQINEIIEKIKNC